MLLYPHTGYQAAYDFNKSINKLIHEICRPLFEATLLNFFAYNLFQNDGKQFTICSNLDLMRYTFEQDLMPLKSNIFYEDMEKAPLNKVCLVLWAKLSKDIFGPVLAQFNILNGASFFKREAECVHVWSFGSRLAEPDMVDFYTSNQGLLMSFIEYFKDKGMETIFKSLQKAMILTDDTMPPYNPAYTQEVEAIRESLSPKRFWLKDGNYLTSHEEECIRFLAEGKSIKEIALMRKLSPRTVESYLANARSRLGAQGKAQLINLWKESCLSTPIH